MAISLASKTNVTAPGGAYPYGNIKDDTGSNDGTPVDVQTYADFHQFFAKIADEGSITLNDLPENSTNGFQYYDALVAVIANRMAALNVWTAIPQGNITLNADVSFNASLTNIKYLEIGKKVNIIANIELTTGAGFTPNDRLDLEFSKATYFETEPTDTTNDTIVDVGVVRQSPYSADPEFIRVIYSNSTSDQRILLQRIGSNFDASATYRFSINSVLEIK